MFACSAAYLTAVYIGNLFIEKCMFVLLLIFLSVIYVALFVSLFVVFMFGWFYDFLNIYLCICVLKSNPRIVQMSRAVD